MSRLPGIALGLLLLTGAPSAPQADAARAWLDGRTDDALRALERLPDSRERELNRAVVLLHRGEAEAAEGVLRRLRARAAGWLPALRWLGRAEKDLGRAALPDTAALLVRSGSATAGDQLWAARVFAERRDLGGARDALRRAAALDPDLYAAWTGLAEAEAALGNADASRVAKARADALRPGGPTAFAAPLRPLPASGLRYRAKYLFLPLAELTLSERGPLDFRGRRARELALSVHASGPLLRMSSRYESYLDADGDLLGRRQTSSDSGNSRRQAVVERDAESGAFRTRQVRDGLFHYDVLASPTPARAYDGPSLIEAARAVARSGTAVSVLRVADAGWKSTPIRPVRNETIRWQGKDVATTRVEIGIGSRGAAGLQGGLELWISADERALPYRARMAIVVGSVTVELQADEAPAPAER